ncbi:MAG TPA: GSU2403 family nucleotidyltransferase fold protein [Roseateles sp.]|nr:GSU2403 family nucleotidyltransferase fold protein [Roseateles sp.]
MVNVPRPERYALAKLLVYMERLDSKQPEKAKKDQLQAATLIDYLSAERPDDLKDAWEDLLSRGKGWKSRAGQALTAMRERFPEALCVIEMPVEPRPARKPEP